MLVDLAYTALGVAGLFAGARWLVRSGANLAISFGVSRLMTGLTVVALGVSAPALATNVTAALRDSPDMAVGNVIGSNMAGIGLGLGVAGLIAGLMVSDLKVKAHLWVMALLTFLIALMVYDGAFGRLEGVFLVVVYVGYVVYAFQIARYDRDDDDDVGMNVSRWRDVVVLVAGLVAVVAGALGMVIGAEGLASRNGIDEMLIGMTVVALGTSLPLIVGAITLTRRGGGDRAVDSVVNSNISNLTLVLGLTAILSPMTFAPSSIRFGFGAMLVLAVALLPMLRDRRFSRVESGLLLAGYLVFGALAIFVVFA